MVIALVAMKVIRSFTYFLLMLDLHVSILMDVEIEIKKDLFLWENFSQKKSTLQ